MPPASPVIPNAGGPLASEARSGARSPRHRASTDNGCQDQGVTGNRQLDHHGCRQWHRKSERAGVGRKRLRRGARRPAAELLRARRLSRLSPVAATRSRSRPTCEMRSSVARLFERARGVCTVASTSLFNNSGRLRERLTDRGSFAVGLDRCRRDERDRYVPLHPGGIPGDEGPGSRWSGRIINNGSIAAHVPATRFGRLHDHQARAITGLTEVHRRSTGANTGSPAVRSTSATQRSNRGTSG